MESLLDKDVALLSLSPQASCYLLHAVRLVLVQVG